MKSFRTLQWKAERCKPELDKLRSLLGRHVSLEERQHVLPLFKKCLHLTGFLGSYIADVGPIHRVAHEYDLFGDFLCDVVVGDSTSQVYLFVEFESGARDSVFKRQGKKAKREWSPHFDHGYSQMIDWFCKLRDMEKTDEFEARFGARTIEYSGLLVAGRERFFESGERHRFQWRRRSVVVDSKKIQCVTYDELLTDLTYRLNKYSPTSRGV